uniref:Uncharacterized protein n=1 Tax=Arundo donax TaxID=35708 RepID=A0A0A9HJE0_ARUDO
MATSMQIIMRAGHRRSSATILYAHVTKLGWCLREIWN